MSSKLFSINLGLEIDDKSHHQLEEMKQFLDNNSIPLGLHQNGERTNASVFIFEAEDAAYPEQLFRSETSQWANVSLSWIFVMIVGTYFRFVLYEYLYEQYRENDFTTINALTLVTSLLQHLGLFVITFSRTMIVLTGTSLTRIPGLHSFCTFRQYFVQFTIFYGFVGGLGIAIYRLFLIKRSRLINQIKFKTIGSLILLGGILLCVFLVIMANSHEYGKLQLELCLLKRNGLVYEVLNEYEQSRDNHEVLSNFRSLRKYAGIICFIAVVSEMIIYVMFFHHLYKNDNNVDLKKLLDKKVIKARNRKNAITFFGQFCSFIIEMTQIALYVNALRTDKEHIMFEVVLNLYQISFAAISIVEVLTSYVLRVRLAHKLENILQRLFNLIFNVYGN